MAIKRRATGSRGKPRTADQRATQRRIEEDHNARAALEQADLIQLDRLKAEVCELATGEALHSLQVAINHAISTWLDEHRVAATRPRTTISQVTQRRIREVLLALGIPERDWVKRIDELRDAIAAGQSLDDLSQVNLNDVMAAALDTLMQRYLTAQERYVSDQGSETARLK